MPRRGKFILPFIICGSFLFATFASAKVLISQIQIAGVSTTDEFVELYNYSSSSQSIVGWSLKKQTAGGTLSNLVASFGNSATLGPFGYFLVAHKDYQPTNGVTADALYSNNSTNLAPDNAVILSDANGTLVDRVDWGSIVSPFGFPSATNPPPGKSLVRLPNDATGNGTDTENSSLDFVTSTSNPFNSMSAGRPAYVPDIVPVATSTEPTSTDSAGCTGTCSVAFSTPPTDTPLMDWLALKINEVMSNPIDGPEWVELYNSGTTTIDLSGAILCDNRASGCTIAALSGTLASHNWATIFLSSAHLNNDGDSVILKGSNGTIVDAVAYSGSLIPGAGQTVARAYDGADTNSDTDWTVTAAPTPGAANAIVTPLAASKSSGGSGGFYSAAPSNTASTLVYATSTSPIVLSELYPDPASGNNDDEFIELHNISLNSIDLTRWKLSDTSRSFVLSEIIEPNGYAVFTRHTTAIALNNANEETVRLFNEKGEIADEVSYDSAVSGESYSRDENNRWQWSAQISLGASNIIKTTRHESVSVAWNVLMPTIAVVGQKLIFNAEGSADPRGGKLVFDWNFGDSTSSTGAIVTHAYSATGTFAVTLTASSTQNTQSTATRHLTVGLENESRTPGIILNEVFTNPASSEQGEFIELMNSGTSTISLAGWLITNHTDSYSIPDGTTVAPGETATFYKVATHLNLDNQSETVTLLSPFNSIEDSVTMPKSTEGKSYSRFGTAWQWALPSPGAPNAMVLGEKITSPTTERTKSARTVLAARAINLSGVRELPKGTRVSVEGIISAEPGVFSNRYFYISGPEGGIQIYFTKAASTSLQRGDVVRVVGTMSALNGIPRINVKNAWDVRMLQHGAPPIPNSIDIDESEELPLGTLAVVSGEITEISGNSVYLDNGSNEIQMYLRPASHIAKSTIVKGENMEILGILEASKNGIQLLPRSASDLIDKGPSDDIVKGSAPVHMPLPHAYSFATIGGALLLAVGLTIRYRSIAIQLWRRLLFKLTK